MVYADVHGLKSDDVTVLKYVRLVGHAENHAAFVLEEEQSIFSGDHVLGFGTTVVSDLHDYMVSLHLLLDEVPNRLYEMLCAVALLFFGGVVVETSRVLMGCGAIASLS